MRTSKLGYTVRYSCGERYAKLAQTDDCIHLTNGRYQLRHCFGSTAVFARKGDEAAIRELEAKWDTAAINNDVKMFNAILADGFVSMNSRAEAQTKSQMLEAMKAGNLKFLTSKSDDQKVFLHGDAAVVTGRWKSKYIENGKNYDVLERYTASYARQNGVWRCTSTHSSTVQATASK